MHLLLRFLRDITVKPEIKVQNNSHAIAVRGAKGILINKRRICRFNFSNSL